MLFYFKGQTRCEHWLIAWEPLEGERVDLIWDKLLKRLFQFCGPSQPFPACDTLPCICVDDCGGEYSVLAACC